MSLFMQTWVPIGDQLPDPGTKVLISFDDGSVDAYWQKWADDPEDGFVNAYVNDDFTGYRHVTAWMYLPEPYQEGANEK
jgi:hypothetical protein